MTPSTNSIVAQGDYYDSNRFGNDGGDVTTSYTPYVSVGCVMFPVFILVWYRYSKQYCRSFGRDGCSHQDFEMMEDEYYHQHSSSDGFDEYSPMELTDRLVKWINRQNVFGFENSTMRRTTMESDGNVNTRSDSSVKDCFCDDLDGDLFWECIPNSQQAQQPGSTMELSSSTTVNRVRQTQVPTMPMNTDEGDYEAPIVVSDSAESKNSIVMSASASR